MIFTRGGWVFRTSTVGGFTTLYYMDGSKGVSPVLFLPHGKRWDGIVTQLSSVVPWKGVLLPSSVPLNKEYTDRPERPPSYLRPKL